MTGQVGDSFLRTIADALPALIAHWDTALRCSFANRQYSQWLGRNPEDILGASMPDVLGEHLFGLAKPYVDRVLTGAEQQFDRVLTKPDGTVVHAWVNYVPHRDEAGDVCGFFVLVTDVTPLHQAEQRAIDSERQYRLLADHSSDMIFQIDRDFVRRYASPASREILGYEPEELVGVRPVNQVHPEDAERVAAVFRSLVDGSVERNSVTNRIRHKEGHWVWVEVELRSIQDPRTGLPSGMIGAMRDISLRKSMEVQLAEANRRLLELARQDGLTGLANRRSFDEVLDRYDRAVGSAGGPLAMIMIDVDWFKPFNDRYGHPAGDDCLKWIGTTINASIRPPTQVAARYGGEEFVILMPDTDEAAALSLAEALRRSIETVLRDHDASPLGRVTISAGVAVLEGGESERRSADLLQAADRALYAAKRAGRNLVLGASRLAACRTEASLRDGDCGERLLPPAWLDVRLEASGGARCVLVTGSFEVRQRGKRVAQAAA